MPGQSGNPGGRPKGLARRVRDLVGDDGYAIAEFMFGVMADQSARTSDRIEAAKWLADRGFGRAVQGLEIEMSRTLALDLSVFSIEDMEAMLAILDKYDGDVGLRAESGEIEFERGSARTPPARGS
jgi:hypothetical protein